MMFILLCVGWTVGQTGQTGQYRTGQAGVDRLVSVQWYPGTHSDGTARCPCQQSSSKYPAILTDSFAQSIEREDQLEQN